MAKVSDLAGGPLGLASRARRLDDSKIRRSEVQKIRKIGSSKDSEGSDIVGSDTPWAKGLANFIYVYKYIHQ